MAFKTVRTLWVCLPFSVCFCTESIGLLRSLLAGLRDGLKHGFIRSGKHKIRTWLKTWCIAHKVDRQHHSEWRPRFRWWHQALWEGEINTGMRNLQWFCQSLL
jgi:hypothetical protein